MVVRAPRLVRNPSRILFRTHLIPRASPFKPLAVQASPFSSGTLSMEVRLGDKPGVDGPSLL